MVITRSWPVARIVLPRGISSRQLGVLPALLAGAWLFSYGQLPIKICTAGVERPSAASGILALDQYLVGLRSQLEDRAAERLIETVRGVGYCYRG